MKKSFLAIFVAALLGIITFSSASTGNTAKCQVLFAFDGLGVIAFGDPSRASLGILDVVHHTPQIQIKTLESGREKNTQTISNDQLKNKVITISVPKSQLHPQRYYSPDMTKDTADFRWCLDLESDLFQKQLYLKQDKLFAKIHFTTGTFYTTNLTSDKYQFTAGSTLHSFNRQIGTPAASVKLQQGQALIIAGLSENIVLLFKANVSYEIAITNLPPKNMMSMDHFLYYYDALKTPVKKFMPVEAKRATYGPRPLYCDTIILSKSTIS